MEGEHVYVDEEISFQVQGPVPNHTGHDRENTREPFVNTGGQSVYRTSQNGPYEHPPAADWQNEMQCIKQLVHNLTLVQKEMMKELERLKNANRNGNSGYLERDFRASQDSRAGDTRPHYSENRSRSSVHHRSREGSCTAMKLPPFMGKESWKVWINRFEAIAERQGLDEDNMLDQLLPKLQGEAAEFVFVQLPSSTLHDYSRLVKELDSRYRVVETSKTFASQFSRRVQKVGESAEEFAADLKRLYDRAHRGRDRITRQEDLVRKFLDGLCDDEARFEIEFHKEPDNIDEAVYQAVNFMQTRRPSYPERSGDKRERKYVRCVKVDEEEESDHIEIRDENYETLRRVPSTHRQKSQTKEQSKVQEHAVEKESNREILNLLLEKLDEMTKQMTQPQSKEGQAYCQREQRKQVICYRCGQSGHMARNCKSNQGSSSGLSYSKGPQGQYQSDGFNSGSYHNPGYNQGPSLESNYYHVPRDDRFYQRNEGEEQHNSQEIAVKARE